MIRVAIPYHLQNLARTGPEIILDLAVPVSVATIVDKLESCYPPLRGTIRAPNTGQRRKLVRFFACGEDLSNDPLDTPLPAAVQSGAEPLLIIGAIAGG